MKLIKVSDEYYKKLEKVIKEKGCTYGEAAQSLEKVILKNFPHSTATELVKCGPCRASVISVLQSHGYWPKPEIKEVIKIVEVPAGKIEEGPIKHLPREIKTKHLT